MITATLLEQTLMNNSNARTAGWLSNAPSGTHPSAVPKSPAAFRRLRALRDRRGIRGAGSPDRMRSGDLERAPPPRRPQRGHGAHAHTGRAEGGPQPVERFGRPSARDPGGGVVSAQARLGPGSNSGISASPSVCRTRSRRHGCV